ncbi:beta-ketoacyl-ACP synthase III [Hydrogenophaga sp. PAMC20947]|uniref:beta-ketoacyl-ACP synthase III n=1 Tax=Hydrogenophaga sp. PAMC20947 TaxID=2565558 RepID=UPI00109DA61C|nr:beta-ketoacyl-ACP synthase III [Hydrogenophaga sp. PAMC20947]QCB45004.1 StlD/DarB family beta-ketosynthase [Hydrogenophaga sp. PAMC20947]
MSTPVYITRTAAYLPFAPVGNHEMESVLGRVADRPSRARALVLRSNGITSRHYAIDRATGQTAMSNAQLTANAIRALGDAEGIEVLATGTSTPDQLLPNHAVMVHGELGWPRLEAVACAGICLSGIAALKHAWMSIAVGGANKAVACASELVSPMMRGHRFEAEVQHKVQALEQRPEIAFEKDFLRWMLSDGAAALMLQSTPGAGLSLRIRWISLSSAAHELPTCMYAGADKASDTDALQGWLAFTPQQHQERSVFAIKQDVKLLNANIVRATLAEPLETLAKKHGLKADDIDWFLPHISSMYFYEPVMQALAAIGLPIPRERWFTNLTSKGNTGSAAPYIMLDELFQSGRIQRGQTILMFIPESGRFSSGFVFMEAC